MPRFAASELGQHCLHISPRTGIPSKKGQTMFGIEMIIILTWVFHMAGSTSRGEVAHQIIPVWDQNQGLPFLSEKR